jgi:hypothetical protein
MASMLARPSKTVLAWGRYPALMEEKKAPADASTQETPQGHKIPVPTRKQVFRDLEKVAKRPPSQAGRRRPQK